MKPLAAEWINKAEADFATVKREPRARKNPNYDGLCFHAQQCAEMYLKARLCEDGIDIVRTHDLVALLQSVLVVEPTGELLREDLAFLSEFAVSIQYPGESADRGYARSAWQRCRRFRDVARKAFGLETLIRQESAQY